MNPNWLGVLSAVGALIAFVLVYATFRRTGKKPKAGTLVLALLLAVPGASFAAYYAHVLPEPDWYYAFRSWSGTELLLIVVGVAGGVFASLLLLLLLFESAARYSQGV